MSKIFTAFAAITIIIALLGLFGVASINIVRRLKEIALRKVLGATLFNNFYMIAKDFIKLIIVANLIAWPFIYYLLSQWLTNYAKHVSINLWVFILAGFCTCLISFLCIGYCVLVADNKNPSVILKE